MERSGFKEVFYRQKIEYNDGKARTDQLLSKIMMMCVHCR